jgi:hypothetical protein
MEKSFLYALIGKRVKVLYSDEDLTHVVKGILQEVQEDHLVVDGVVIGRGKNFISCIPQEGNHEAY